MSNPCHSTARRWPALRVFVLDAVADALHSQAALRGAQPHVTLLLSRSLLPLTAAGAVALEALSGELRRMGLSHAFHCVSLGEPEPAQHWLCITFKCMGQSAQAGRNCHQAANLR